MIPWRLLWVFLAVAVGATTAIAVLCAAMGWTVTSPMWAALAPLAMWAPALARLVARRSVDRGFTATMTLRRWGDSGASVILGPLAIPLLVYGAAYAIAWSSGLVQWSPGAGEWKTGTQILANLIINLSILGIFGTFTAMGEEIGWRGYLQPRLDAAGGDNALWLGEGGVLPVAGYVVLGSLAFVWMRRHGPSWNTLVRGAIGTGA